MERTLGRLHWTTQVAVLALLIGLALGLGGAERALTTAALHSPVPATGTVTGTQEGSGFGRTRDAAFVEVSAQVDGRQQPIRVYRFAPPLPKVGDRYAIEYGHGRFVGLVAQQAGYKLSTEPEN
jgi:hypothetical protein